MTGEEQETRRCRRDIRTLGRRGGEGRRGSGRPEGRARRGCRQAGRGTWETLVRGDRGFRCEQLGEERCQLLQWEAQWGQWGRGAEAETKVSLTTRQALRWVPGPRGQGRRRSCPRAHEGVGSGGDDHRRDPTYCLLNRFEHCESLR